MQGVYPSNNHASHAYSPSGSGRYERKSAPGRGSKDHIKKKILVDPRESYAVDIYLLQRILKGKDKKKREP